MFFLAGICMALGLFFVWLDSAAGWIFIVVALTVLTMFSLLGAREGYRADTQPTPCSKKLGI